MHGPSVARVFIPAVRYSSVLRKMFVEFLKIGPCSDLIRNIDFWFERLFSVDQGFLKIVLAFYSNNFSLISHPGELSPRYNSILVVKNILVLSYTHIDWEDRHFYFIVR